MVTTSLAATHEQVAGTGDGRPPEGLRGLGVWSLVDVLTLLSVVGPFGAILVRWCLTAGGPVYLSGDQAVVDLDVRQAMAFQRLLGPWDEFGWHHPGPVYFYVLAIPSWILGAGARSEYIGVALIGAGCSLATVYAVRRWSGPLAGLWTSICTGLLMVVMSSPIGWNPVLVPTPIVNLWNPFVVTFPLLLFAVLCAAGAATRPLALLGAALVGSFCVQTDISTTPLVVVLIAGAAAVALVRRATRREPRPPDAEPRTRHRRPRTLLPGLALLVLMWVPTLQEQVTDHPGNLTLMADFFTVAHTPHSLGAGLWTVLAFDAAPFQGLPVVSQLGTPYPGALWVLVVVVVLGALPVAIGTRTKNKLAVGLGLASLFGLGVAIVSVTRIVGPIFGYLTVWEFAVPMVALIGVGVALVSRPPVRSTPRSSRSPRQRAVPVVALSALAVLTTVALTIRFATLPSVTAASNPAVAAAYRDVTARLPRGGQPFFVNFISGFDLMSLYRSETYRGLVASLIGHGYQARSSTSYDVIFGNAYVSSGRGMTTVIIYPSSPSIERSPGFAGHLSDGDIVVTKATGSAH